MRTIPELQLVSIGHFLIVCACVHVHDG